MWGTTIRVIQGDNRSLDKAHVIGFRVFGFRIYKLHAGFGVKQV